MSRASLKSPVSLPAKIADLIFLAFDVSVCPVEVRRQKNVERMHSVEREQAGERKRRKRSSLRHRFRNERKRFLYAELFSERPARRMQGCLALPLFLPDAFVEVSHTAAAVCEHLVFFVEQPQIRAVVVIDVQHAHFDGSAQSAAFHPEYRFSRDDFAEQVIECLRSTRTPLFERNVVFLQKGSEFVREHDVLLCVRRADFAFPSITENGQRRHLLRALLNRGCYHVVRMISPVVEAAKVEGRAPARHARRIFAFALLAILTILVLLIGVDKASGLYTATATTTPQTQLVSFGGVSLRLQYALTPSARALGLGGRSSVPSDYGMLFVFPTDGYYGFWMKDTLVPLDMFWLNDKGHVVSMAENVATSSYPHVLYPSAPARYVLETAAGFARAHGIATGTPLLLKKFPIVLQ